MPPSAKEFPYYLLVMTCLGCTEKQPKEKISISRQNIQTGVNGNPTKIANIINIVYKKRDRLPQMHFIEENKTEQDLSVGKSLIILKEVSCTSLLNTPDSIPMTVRSSSSHPDRSIIARSVTSRTGKCIGVSSIPTKRE